MSNADRFKFRIWKPKAKELCHSDEFAIDATGMIWNLLDEEPYAEADTNIVDMCTGLRDKNGRLIYEGDIIKHTVVSYSFIKEFETRVSSVLFSENAASWMIEGASHIAAFNSKIAKDSEIIGNIHENPELLKEQE